MQPYFFPYIGYFQLINAVDKFVIYDDVNYINKGWINRNNILINKSTSLVKVPLLSASQNRQIKDIEVIPDNVWKKKLLKTISLSYKKSCFFGTIFPKLEEILLSDYRTISDLNYLAITNICSYLNINTDIKKSSVDYENTHLKGENRIIDICMKEKACMYINPKGGKNLYKYDKFDSNLISLKFIFPKNISYDQNISSFVPYLSMIDTLMFCSSDEIQSNLLNQYDLL